MSYPPPNPNQPPMPPGFRYGPAGGPASPFGPPPRKNRKPLIFGILGGAVALCCAGGAIAALTGGDEKPDAASVPAKETTPTSKATGKAAPLAPKNQEPKKPAAAPETEPGLGDPVRDGKFEFTVSNVDCTKTQVGSKYLNAEAQGKFCVISVTVKNIGKEAQTFSGSSQKAFDGDNTEYSNDTGAELYANEGSPTFLEEVNPGNQVKGKLIFDVPKATKLTYIELHDSMFSGGVKVNLK